MGLLEDIMKTLERVPGWKRISGAPAEIDALKARVAALEAKLAPGGQMCPLCNEPAMKVTASIPHPEFDFAGVKLDTLRCSACGHEETRQREPR
ncbi:hypothetical protein L0Z13_08515 [Burkholderia multivorans]|jgi:uncharacterized protein with PIN domain|nr:MULTISPECIES: hypothetical protein [Burkholderia cepacia complex]EJO58063.1 hypothetical protein BURMUCF2_2053 [Burkholderia multivorans CF2]AJY17842.1 hypothetical protein NP80_2196 [Burkholderia multivorans ATCC BAA-247]MBR8056790.1 hypothetical protein [Burkholderia dolosa]MBU9165174.1 hypothetical protein [Burkholderia multivorans]MBU9373637.1 hypothetical protein [Burkholderia multivorans]